MLDAVKNALVGTGGDASTLCKDESRLLALQIMKVAQPKNRQKTADRIRLSASEKFIAFGESSYQFDSGKASKDGIWWRHWDSDHLYGVAPDKDMRRASTEDLADIYFGGTVKKYGNSKGAYIDLPFSNPRQRQKVRLYQKIVTGKSAVNKLARYAQKSIGKLPASWLATARQIDNAASAPQWISRHLKGNSTTKSITDLTGLNNPDNPSSAFGSKAKGVGRFARAVQFAVNLREKKLAHRLELILSGYAQSVRNGIKVSRQAGRVKGQP